MSLEEDMRSALATFVEEARELIQDMEDGLLGLEHTDDPAEIVNAVFRAAHTIKGSSGLFGLDRVVEFTHVLESVLDGIRNEQIAVTSELVGTLLPCADHLTALMTGVGTGEQEESPQLAAQGARLAAALRTYLDGPVAGCGEGEAGSSPAAANWSAVEPDDSTPGRGPAAPATEAGEPAPGGRARQLHLSLRFGRDCLRNGMDPLAFIRYLSTMGDIVALTTLDDLLPAADEFDPESCYLDFQVTLVTEASNASVAGVFDFVADESDISVLGPQDPPSAYAELVRSYGPRGSRVRQILAATGAVGAVDLAAALGEPPVPAGPSVPQTGPEPVVAQRSPVELVPAQSRSGPSPVDAGDLASQVASPATSTPRAAGQGAAEARPAPSTAAGVGHDSRTIRIDASRLDRLIDAVGELVIAGASASLRASVIRDEALVTSIGEVMRLVEEVRDGALQLRMVPIGTTFSRFQRVVRDVSADLGKEVNLVISGGETEVDKALVEQIGDPLMHLVRNSMDHGIESPQVRTARGKPARGTLQLNAFHDSGSIVIEVTDDGAGIDAQRVMTKAIERGLVEPGTSLTDQEICQLIFEPGFSTADAVSNLSGRGVGLDVVKRNVSALRGTVDVENRPELGATMRIRLPLTLAIIDGFLVGVAGASFVIPLDQVIECVELPTSANSRDCMDLRGEVLPFIRLRSLFGMSGEPPRRENVVVVEYAGMKIGLVVDALMGEFQTVIKPLSRVFEHVHGIGGSTILGNGDVALIIDVPLLVRHFGDRQGAGAMLAAARE
jgi:two-component system chemotaxis sensor kinase CheA